MSQLQALHGNGVMLWILCVPTCRPDTERHHACAQHETPNETFRFALPKMATARRRHMFPCRVISWPISVIVEARSQLEHATKDKLEGDGDKVLRWKGSDFSNLWALWLNYPSLCDAQLIGEIITSAIWAPLHSNFGVQLKSKYT
jgi:hypothetical protein